MAPFIFIRPRLLGIYCAILALLVAITSCSLSPGSSPVVGTTPQTTASTPITEPTNVPTNTSVSTIESANAPAVTAALTSAPTNVPETSSTSAPTLEPTSAPTETTAGSVLSRRDAPPEGVADELEFIATGIAGVCLSGPNEPLGIMTQYGAPTDAQELATTFFICFTGFAPDQPVNTQVTRPDGAVVQEQLAPSDIGEGYTGYHLLWESKVGDPLGEYVVTATQGERQATGSFTIQASTVPRVMVNLESSTPGTTFTIMLAGFQPNQSVSLYLYYQTEECNGERAPCWRYATTLPPAQVNQRGEATTTLTSQSGDPELSYQIISNPAAELRLLGGSMFSLRRQ